jgi:hypothetical protein
MRPVLFAVFAMGCGPRPAPAAAAVGAAPPKAREVLPAPAAGPSLAKSLPLNLVPLAPPALPASLPRLEVLEPSFGDTLEPRFARRHPVRVRADPAWLTADAEGVLVSLDGGRPRRVLPDSSLTLGDLLPFDQVLTEGAHVLLALAVAADGRALRVPVTAAVRPLSLVGFFVGPRVGEPASGTSPQLFCLSPVGTHYLKPDAALPFEVLAVGWEPPVLGLRVRAAGGEFESAFDPSLSYLVQGAPVGDVLFSIGSASGPHAECVATVNPELAERKP